METSLVQKLISAKNALTPDTWRKGKYFQLEGETLCMCAHGAIARENNPNIRVHLQNNFLIDAINTANHNNAEQSGEYARKINPHLSLLSLWDRRHDHYWVETYPKSEIHFLLGLVGLTTKFNDDDKTTLEMIHQKFDEAIELAKLIEEQHE